MALKVNEYFAGNVKSIGYEGMSGRATVGVMAPGAYDFTTATVEIVTVVDGTLTVRLPGAAQEKAFRAGESFEVGANATFHLVVGVPTSYHCVFRD